MEAFGDSVTLCEAPHADDRFKPLTYGTPQFFEYLRSIMKHLPHHFLEPFLQRYAIDAFSLLPAQIAEEPKDLGFRVEKRRLGV